MHKSHFFSALMLSGWQQKGLQQFTIGDMLNLQ